MTDRQYEFTYDPNMLEALVVQLSSMGIALPREYAGPGIVDWTNVYVALRNARRRTVPSSWVGDMRGDAEYMAFYRAALKAGAKLRLHSSLRTKFGNKVKFLDVLSPGPGGKPRYLWFNGAMIGHPPSLVEMIRRDDAWNDNDTAHFEYHAENPHGSPHAMWYRSRQDVTIVARGSSCVPEAWTTARLDDRIKAGTLRAYVAKWFDGYVDEVWEDELSNCPDHWRIADVEKIAKERTASLPTRVAVLERVKVPVQVEPEPERTHMTSRERSQHVDLHGSWCDECGDYHLYGCPRGDDNLNDDGLPYCDRCDEYHDEPPVDWRHERDDAELPPVTFSFDSDTPPLEARPFVPFVRTVLPEGELRTGDLDRALQRLTRGTDVNITNITFNPYRSDDDEVGSWTWPEEDEF